MPHVFPAKYLGMVPAAADIDVALHQHPPNGTAASIDWYSGKGADGPVAVTDINTPADKETQQDWRRNYYAAAAFSDAVFGELLAELDVLGFTDNTLVIMTSDHGWGLGEHNHWVKYTNCRRQLQHPFGSFTQHIFFPFFLHRPTHAVPHALPHRHAQSDADWCLQT